MSCFQYSKCSNTICSDFTFANIVMHLGRKGQKAAYGVQRLVKNALVQ